MQAGKFETGCPALEESFRLDPLAGVLFTSAECHAKWGQVATSVARFQDYLSRFGRMSPSEQARQRGRDEMAKKRLAELEPQVPHLTLVLPASAPAGTQVSRGGVVLGAPSLGVSLPIDPGEHVVSTRVPGGEPRENRITIAAGERKTVELEISLPDAVVADQGTAAGAVTPAQPDQAAGGANTAAFVIGGVGVAGLVVGSVTGAMALGKKSVVDENCAGAACNAEGKEAADSGQRLGLVSTVGFGVGIAGVGVAAILFATSSKAPAQEKAARWAPAAVIGSDGALIGLVGAFR